MPDEILSLRYVALDDCHPWKPNPKDHDLGTIHQSMRRFGFTAPLIVNEATGELAAGHGRLLVLRQMRDNREEPPARIRVERGRWMVPVIYGVRLDGQEHGAYVIADNRSTTLGGWNLSELVPLLGDLDDLTGTGYDLEDLDRLRDDLDKPFTPEEGRSARDRETGAAGTVLQVGAVRMGLERQDYLAWEAAMIERFGSLDRGRILEWVREQIGL